MRESHMEHKTTHESDNDQGESIDISRFEELSDGDRTGLLELIQLYLVKTTEQILELEKAIAAGESTHISRIAHSMVGASAMVGMDSLLPNLRELEGYGEKSQLAQAQHSFEQVCRQFKRFTVNSR